MHCIGLGTLLREAIPALFQLFHLSAPNKCRLLPSRNDVTKTDTYLEQVPLNDRRKISVTKAAHQQMHARHLAIANRSRVSCAHKVTTNNSTDMTFKGHSRSSEMSQFDRTHMISYYRSTVTMALSCTVSHI